jgi:hypothetical protein
MKKFIAALAALSAFVLFADEEKPAADALAERLSFSAYADVETAYLCRGRIYDTRPFAVQSASLETDLKPFGSVETTIWMYSPMSHDGFTGGVSRYAYAEIDYLLRYYYDIDFAEGWRLRNGLGRQWVTNPGFRGGHTVCDWQALQILKTPWITPYWRLRIIRRPFDETYWVVGVKRSFDLMEDLSLTVDFFGDIGDRRHFTNIYGEKASGRSWRGGLQALNLVFRLDYRLMDHVSLYGFVGQFCVVSDDARGAVKAASGPEMRRDITYGGAGVAIDF